MIRLLSFCLALLTLLANPIARAEDNKIDVLLGFYSLSVDNANTAQKTSLSSLGAHQIRYRRTLLDHFDFGVGYSYFLTSALSGDSYYGLDIFTQYYPLTSASSVVSSAEDVRLEINERLKPYIGLGFHQRNFQGIQTSYAGFSGNIGADYTLTKALGVIANIRYMSLSATSKLGGTETSFLAGLSFGF